MKSARWYFADSLHQELIFAFLDQKSDGRCARVIAEHFGLNRGFVANILKDLCRKGYVASHRGVNGGYLLRRPLEEISLAELMEGLDEGFHLAECTQPPSSGQCSLLAVCPVKGPIAEVHRRMREVLDKVTLTELFGQACGAVERIDLETSRCLGVELVLR